MKEMAALLIGVGHHIVSSRSFHASQVLATDMAVLELNNEFLNEVFRIKSEGASLSTLGGNACEVLEKLESKSKAIHFASHLGLVVVDCSASTETVEKPT